MTSIFDPKLYAPGATFMGAPNSYDLSGAKAAILGLPYDMGVHPVRIGARLGPSAIREQSALVRPYHPPEWDFNPVTRLGLVDCGNAVVTPSRIAESFERIEEAVHRIVEAGAVPITMGGDGSVSLPQLRALHRKHPDLCVLHIDAHTDAYEDKVNKYTTATTFTRAAEEGVVDVAHSIHLGARSTVYMPGIFEHTRGLGYELIDGREMWSQGLDGVLKHLHRRLAGRPVYLCFDMDFFDPSCAPGVCTPSWGGVNAREGIHLIQGLAGLNLVAFDINTVSPPHDVGGMTAFLAGNVMLQCLALVAHGLQIRE
jgi:agmatinase